MGDITINGESFEVRSVTFGKSEPPTIASKIQRRIKVNIFRRILEIFRIVKPKFEEIDNPFYAGTIKWYSRSTRILITCNVSDPFYKYCMDLITDQYDNKTIGYREIGILNSSFKCYIESLSPACDEVGITFAVSGDDACK